jgi:hypothetical protein
MAALIVEQVNAEAPERIEGINIVDMASTGSNPNWTTGDYWPPATKGGLTEIILYGVINDLRHAFDIEG